ncbi:hypothetical protein [Pseudonocardia parietis]|uniref:Tetracycline repressor-like protein n=1 Tax=Pseudonocardia parietis TaxID=570936 RepID=A0ABS4W577_9PSEU|nr:hypothetical protein [Pseudonocardia parietis]MBP2371370.1 hypothetical protein [Pseudonocardia parietis]
MDALARIEPFPTTSVLLAALLRLIRGIGGRDGHGVVAGMFMHAEELRRTFRAIRPHLETGDRVRAELAAAEALTPGYRTFSTAGARTTAREEGRRFVAVVLDAVTDLSNR